MATALIKCEACNADISKETEKCPHCGHPNKSFKKKTGCFTLIVAGFLAFILIIVVIAANQSPEERAAYQQKQAEKAAQEAKAANNPPQTESGDQSESHKKESLLDKAQSAMTDAALDGTYTKVINDSIDQYNITKRNGSKIEVCVHAGMVSAAFLQAKDEEGYQKWKAIEKKDCKKAGMPAM